MTVSSKLPKNVWGTRYHLYAQQSSRKLSRHAPTYSSLQCVYQPEMSIGPDLDWTGSGLLQILLNLDWIRTVKLFKI